ncbi:MULTISPECIES: glutamyl-tRNA reductase [unclassified Streptococcus]|uniref:glutamyl-tRNA reductase n=1 Tax=unclassified Streptococcus TaxID=2608887 RepID=UPI0010724D8E|nr:MULTISPECIES: glutamyl-tRNA reductase [unclassified Streptococcus]MBF0805565.1 glutamyl-tRNA reductase [Streptococcus sp. 19428wA2_WM07]TFU28933.1 glutamyl-tRNA reductase [Streptococcus sp. WM07]
MYLLSVGLSHEKSDLSLLEECHFSSAELEHALIKLKKEKSVLENLIISTCHRTELYLVVDQLHTGRYYGKRFLAHWFHKEIAEIEPYIEVREEEQALEHLLQVSVGLKSNIIGETQILGQLKAFFKMAFETGTTGILLNHICRQVLTFAKKMHQTYQIDARPQSLGRTVFEMLEHANRTKETLLIIGLGEMGSLITRHALETTMERIILVNRSPEKAQPFLGDERVEFWPWEDLGKALQVASIVISAADVGRLYLESYQFQEGSLVFDLCHPRTVAQEGELELYSLHHISNQFDQHMEQRQAIAADIIQDMREELLAYQVWKEELEVVPVLRELRAQALAIQEGALASLERKFPEWGEREHKQISKHMKSILNQFLRQPILYIKELPNSNQKQADLELVKELFGLGKEDGDEKSNPRWES